MLLARFRPGLLAFRLVAFNLIALNLISCGDVNGDRGTGSADDDVDKASLLVGAWQTTGQDPDLGGQAEVRLELQAAGTLRITVTQSGGASLSFPGTWSLVDASLFLRGAWFQPDGEVEVRCEIQSDQLILTAADGSSQTWERRE